MSLDIDTHNPRQLKVQFILDTSHPIGQVSVVGSFNNWTPGLDELVPEPDGTRSVTIGLPYGHGSCSAVSHPATNGSTNLTPTRSPRKGRFSTPLSPPNPFNFEFSKGHTEIATE
jgi:hypothetical protein